MDTGPQSPTISSFWCIGAVSHSGPLLSICCLMSLTMCSFTETFPPPSTRQPTPPCPPPPRQTPLLQVLSVPLLPALCPLRDLQYRWSTFVRNELSHYFLPIFFTPSSHMVPQRVCCSSHTFSHTLVFSLLALERVCGNFSPLLLPLVILFLL